jgi:hypothetical protein
MISIRAANDDDAGRLIGFFEQSAGAETARRMERRWHWQWHLDPRLDAPGYRGVIAEWEGAIVGSVSCIPAGLHLHGSPTPAVWLADVRIDWATARRALRAVRASGGGRDPGLSQGIAAAMFDHSAAAPAQLGKHIAEPMMAICRRIGFVDAPDAGNYMRRTSYAWPLRKALGAVPGRLLGALADTLALRLPRPSLAVQPFDGAFDGRFDRLWERAQSEHPAITRRDAALLNWRYRQHPDTRYRALTIDDGADVRGYLVYKVFERKGRRLAWIVDLLTGQGDGEAARSLVATALRECQREAVERTDFFATGADLVALLAAAGFAPRLTAAKKPQPLLVRHLPVVPFHVTSGDGDVG